MFILFLSEVSNYESGFMQCACFFNHCKHSRKMVEFHNCFVIPVANIGVYITFIIQK